MKTRVLHINTYDLGGGAERVAMDLVVNSSFNSHLLVKEKRSKSENVSFFEWSWQDYVFHLANRLVYRIGIKKDVKSLFSLSEQFNNTLKKLSENPHFQQASILHLHNLHGSYFDLESLLKIGEEKHIIWTLHDMWPMTGGDVYTFDDMGYRKGIGKTANKSFYPLNNPLLDRRQFLLEQKRSIYSQLGKKITFVAVSKWITDNIKASFVISQQNDIRLIENGIDSSLYKNNNNRSWIVPRILFFNSDNPFKGSYVFLSILSHLNLDFQLNVIGKSIDDSRVIFHKDKIISQAEMNDVYNQSDILVFPSIAENFPLTILEAMACGVVVLASDIGGISEIIRNKEQLFKSGDRWELLTKLKLILNNRKYLNQLGSDSERLIKDNYDLKYMIEKYDSLYQKIIEDKYY